jgi:glycosyltransferase involved in cell wall biosynthesis
MEERKHILVDARPLVDPRGGGVRRVATHTLCSLLRTNHLDFTFFTTGAHERELPKVFADHPAVTHVHLKWPNKIWSSLSIFGTTSIDREIQKRIDKKIDGALLMNLGFVGFMEVPYAIVLHDLSFLIHPKWFSRKGRLWHFAVNPREITRRADRVFTVSETTARDAERLLNVPKEKLEVFHPGIPRLRRQEKPTHSRTHAPTHPYVLAFGEHDPRKNVKTAINAVEHLRNESEFQNLQLIIVGSNAYAPTHLRTQDWIIRKSSISDEELSTLYENASAVLYPSWYEGFGLPLHEAAQFGVPCLASTHGALPETAPEGTVFAPPSKPHLWVGMLRDMLKSKAFYSTNFNNRYDEPDVSGFVRWIQQLTYIK